MAYLLVERYNDVYEKEWDFFISQRSINGTFLQSRNFLKYHRNRLEDHSLLIRKGSTIVCVIPACEVWDNHAKVFYSHKGSTFGGVIIGKEFNNIEILTICVGILDRYLQDNNFSSAYLKLTSKIFQKDNSDLLEYLLFKEGYQNYDELSLVIDNSRYNSEILNNFTVEKRRGCKQSFKNNLVFKKLEEFSEIEEFYNLLELSLRKYESKPVHTINELLDFKDNRLKDIVEFYGVYLNNVLISGSMIFKFDKKVYHAQYFASHNKYLNLYPMNFLNYNLIKDAYNRDFEFFSFGISTENKGEILNTSLARFKEGFGAKASINKTFYKYFNKGI